MRSPVPRTILRSQKLTLVLAVAALVVLVVTTSIVLRHRDQTVIQQINYSQLFETAANSRAVSLSIEGELMTVQQVDGTLLQAIVTSDAAQQNVIEAFRKANVPVGFRPIQAGLGMTLLNWVVPILTLLLLAFVGWKVHASLNGRGTRFRRVTATADVKFADVAGVDEAKAELAETVEFLRDPQRFSRLGGRAPRGILLVGPPGTGKTLLARAVANEAAVPFLSVSGSSFQEKFAGVGAARVRRLFAEARKLSPCIIFIDEIDALGRQRGRGGDSASADQDQTLNQLLVEMDGFDRASSVVVISSTNRPDILDSALTRPGRFDREISVNLPGTIGREAILRIHATDLQLEEGLDLQWIARGTPGFSGAELANLMNEAAIAATREDAQSICRKHIEHARDRILMGAARQGFMMDNEERYATAVHEAGHVAVGLCVPNADPIHKVSILPRGRALGVTQSLPEKDRLMKKREYLEDQIAVLLGGRAAEQELLSTMTAGAANDIERAVEIAHSMVAEFGMSPLGPIHLGKSENPRSQALLDRIEEATSDIVSTQLVRAREVVRSNQNSIASLVDRLMAQDTLDADEIKDCFDIQSSCAA